MSENNPIDLEAIRAENKIAQETLRHLCHEKWAGRDGWHWEIPANPSRDTDLQLGASIQSSNKLCDEAESLRQRVRELEGKRLETEDLVNAATELLEVARLRGDNDLPHPADDPKLWTARMQNAWEELQNAVKLFFIPTPTEGAKP